MASRYVSLPARGVWVEIGAGLQAQEGDFRHSPHGECGLKSTTSWATKCRTASLPARGVWVEISTPMSPKSLK